MDFLETLHRHLYWAGFGIINWDISLTLNRVMALGLPQSCFFFLFNILRTNEWI